jgi:general nucleoside transport system permease protein
MTIGRLADPRSLAGAVLVPVASVVLALATVAVLLVVIGANPFDAFGSMFAAALGDAHAISTSVTKAVPRLMAALGIAIAIRAGLWNIGAEGQIYLGGMAATAVVLYAPELPFPLIPLLAIIAATLAGAAWGAIPGALRAWRGVNEVITSLMLVYVGIQVTRYMLEAPWAVPGATFPATEPFGAYARLPIVVPGTLLNLGALLALLAAIAAWFLVDRTRFGLNVRAIGGSPNASRFLGIRVNRMIFLTMAVSGAFAGLAGSIEVLGVRGRLIEGFSQAYGFEAIAVALLGRLHPAGIVGAALLFGVLDAGGAGLQTGARGVSSSIVQIAAGLSVGYVLIGLGIQEKLRERRRTRDALERTEAARADASGGDTSEATS